MEWQENWLLSQKRRSALEKGNCFWRSAGSAPGVILAVGARHSSLDSRALCRYEMEGGTSLHSA